MLIMLLVFSLLVVSALVALFIAQDFWAVIAWVLFASLMIPMWWLLSMPWVALAQGIFALVFNTGLLWSAVHQGERHS